MSDTHVVILAAGKGTRMKSADPKVLHLAGRLPHRARPARRRRAAARDDVVVIGHMADACKTALAKRLGLRFALQAPQLGTGHALLQAEPALAGQVGHGGAALRRRAAAASGARCSALIETHTARGAPPRC